MDSSVRKKNVFHFGFQIRTVCFILDSTLEKKSSILIIDKKILFLFGFILNYKKKLTYNLGDGVALHVSEEDPVQDLPSQLHHVVHVEGGHVGLGPALSAIFHFLLVLHPPGF